MKRLQLDGFKFDIDKCKFVVPKEEYLGNIITPESTEKYPKQIKEIINIELLKDKNSLCSSLAWYNTNVTYGQSAVRYWHRLWN